MFFCLEEALKEKAEEKDKWVSPTLVKGKLYGRDNEVTIINHKELAEDIIQLILRTDESSGGKLTSTIKKKSVIEKIIKHYGVKDCADLHGKKLLVSFTIRKGFVYADQIRLL